MAKESFIIHLDSMDILDELTDEQISQLFKAMVNYNKGIEPEFTGLMKAVFLPFKNQFIRDKKKYEATCKRNEENGHKGGRPKNPEKPKETQENPVGFSETQNNPEKPDSDSDSDKDSENESDFKGDKSPSKSKEEKLKERSDLFYQSLMPFISEYSKEMLRAFFNYWSEPNKSVSKMKFELEKTWELKRRLETWANNEVKFSPKKSNYPEQTITGAPPLKSPEQILAERKAKQDARIFKETH